MSLQILFSDWFSPSSKEIIDEDMQRKHSKVTDDDCVFSYKHSFHYTCPGCKRANANFK
jgi:lipopolysaccharide biosynthesis regulator YciM